MREHGRRVQETAIISWARFGVNTENDSDHISYMKAQDGLGAAYAPLYLRQKRINKLPSELATLEATTPVRVGVPVEHAIRSLEKVGFVPPLQIGDTVLPSTNLGPVARRNSFGWDIVHRDQPKETAYRQHHWCWDQYCGRDETERVCRTVDVPYERYPRTFFPPPSVEMTVSADSAGKLVLVAQALEIEAGDRLKHIINLFLEAFGECQVFYKDMTALVFPRLVKLNWTVLPKGKRPWETLQRELEGIINQAKPANRIVVRERIEYINGFEPSFVAVGQAGFAGYLVFGFPERGVYVLESIYTNNAVYAFGERWEVLSQMTKAEILTDELHLRRFIHRHGWEGELAKFLQKPPGSGVVFSKAA